MLGHVAAAGLGQGVRPPFPGGGLQHDQALVLQLRERRIHRPGAWPPDSAAAITDLLDDLVPVHWFFSQQRECGRAYVAAPCPATAPAVATRPRSEAVRAAVEARTGTESGTEAGPEGAAAAELCPVRTLRPPGAPGAPRHSWCGRHAGLVGSLIEAWRTEPRPEPPAAVIPVPMPAPAVFEALVVRLMLVHLSLP